MSTPTNERARYDALYDWSGLTIFNYVRQRYNAREVTMLDVGAGWGKYSLLFPEYIMDACEIWGLYVDGDMLHKKYRQVFPQDICDFVENDAYTRYDVVIMGDVLEHIDVERAQKVVQKLANDATDLIVSVPYQYPQGEVDGNHYEIHVQDDLTPELVLERYPQLKLLATNGAQGVYVTA